CGTFPLRTPGSDGPPRCCRSLEQPLPRLPSQRRLLVPGSVEPQPVVGLGRSLLHPEGLVLLVQFQPHPGTGPLCIRRVFEGLLLPLDRLIELPILGICCGEGAEVLRGLPASQLARTLRVLNRLLPVSVCGVRASRS